MTGEGKWTQFCRPRGSYPQPDWLIDRTKLAGRFPPRIRTTELWRVAPEWLEQAQDDATLLAIRDQERAGLDIVTDGEMRRESYSNRFATALDGVDIDNPGTALDRSGHPNPVPRVVGRIRRRHPVQVRDVTFLRATCLVGWPSCRLLHRSTRSRRNQGNATVFSRARPAVGSKNRRRLVALTPRGKLVAVTARWPIVMTHPRLR